MVYPLLSVGSGVCSFALYVDVCVKVYRLLIKYVFDAIPCFIFGLGFVFGLNG
jgi:hypothetical protein